MTPEFRISQMLDSSILYIYSIREFIQIDPTYQRMSDIWDLDKRQTLIDSILNGFDLPKIYFHEFMPPQKITGREYKYAIIDGKQRLQTIWKFIENDFLLADDFEYLLDGNVKLGGMTYTDLANKYPNIKIRFDSKVLTIMTIQTQSIELIEDMFSRLNEAVPLNAAEKRNAFGGPLPSIIREISNHPFFKTKLPFDNSRYRHYDLAAKFLYFEDRDSSTDTKKRYLDEFVREFRNRPLSEANKLAGNTTQVLDMMSKTFIENDALLRSVGTVMIYYLLFRFNRERPWIKKIDRGILNDFEQERVENRNKAENSLGDADYDLLEFDRLTSSPNDSSAMQFRYKVLEKFVEKRLSSK